VNPDRAQIIIAACSELHNFLIGRGKEDYCPPGFNDHYNEMGEFVEGIWRKNIPEDSIMNTEVPNQFTGVDLQKLQLKFGMISKSILLLNKARWNGNQDQFF